MKATGLWIAFILIGATVWAQDVQPTNAVPAPVPPPVMWVIQFPDPSQSSELPFSPMTTNIAPDPLSLINNFPPPVHDDDYDKAHDGSATPTFHAQPPKTPVEALSAVSHDNTAPLNSTGVNYYDSTKTQNGVTVLDQMHKSLVIDMNGKVLERLPIGFTNLLADGSLIGAMEKGASLIKLDADRDVIWKTTATPHHEITMDENGDIYLLSKEERLFMGISTEFDVLKKYSPQGKLLYKWSLFDHLKEFVAIISKSAYLNNLKTPYDSTKGVEAYIAQDPSYFFLPTFQQDSNRRKCSYEISHFNSIQVLPENEVSKTIPAFKKGNLLLSFNPYSSYGILNPTTNQLEWVAYLPERATLHTPVLTPNGHILVYENSTGKNAWTNPLDQPCLTRLLAKNPPKNAADEPSIRNWLSVTEYNPITNEIVWDYTATPKEKLRAEGLGNAQRLANGNTLICAATETGGKIFEVTPQKEIVWYYISPEVDTEHNGNPMSFYRARRVDYDLAKKAIPGFKP